MIVKGNVLLISLLAVAVAAAALGLVHMWFDVPREEYLWKSLATLGIAGGVISLLIALEYDLPGSHRKISLYALATLVVCGAGLCVYQIWTLRIAAALFAKILITIFVLVGLLSFFVAAIEDMGTNKKLRDEKFID